MIEFLDKLFVVDDILSIFGHLIVIEVHDPLKINKEFIFIDEDLNEIICPLEIQGPDSLNFIDKHGRIIIILFGYCYYGL